ncbi:hypothetical protein EW026_g2473 [Hermanssonia centrifuga]|uniref:Uncharacterized protein n=1 Tax=Hermanssonia centrifuga TaxID=98765 RepID=A0A4S4KP71_9APHY|nr:hypothetical protein EW026_g2473 [Hermanssonia centrifuga]
MEPVPLKAPALPDSGNNSTPGPSRQAANQQMVFDFTKRKRWADLLVTELTEAIMLVLSVTGQVWGDLLSYVRLLCKTDDDLYPSIPLPVSGSNHTEFSQPQRQPPKEVLFEIKGYPHFVTKSKPSANDGLRGFLNSVERPAGGMIDPATGDEFKCFFAEAKPYPSRNTAMLNTFLELKIEHVRLQERVRLARERAESQSKPRQPPQSRYQPQSYLYPHQGHDGQHQDFERLFYSYGNETGDLPSGSVLPAVNSGANQNSGQDEADPDDQNLPRKKVGVLIFCVCQ